MKKTLLSTVIAASLAGSAFGVYAANTQLSGHSLEQRNAIEAAFDKKNILANAIEVSNDQVRVIIQLQDAPMAQFSGVNPSMSSMAAQKSKKVNFQSSAAKEYGSFLKAQQQSLISTIQSFDPSFAADMSYTASFNGIAGLISKTALEKLSTLSNVKAVYPDTIHHAQMDASLDVIGAIDTWEQLGGKENAGAGVRVAVIDSGIRPENPLFSGENFEAPDPDTLPTDDYCSEVADFCNNKLIVARSAEIVTGFDVVEGEYDSPLGFNGHGTHVAGTAVGNYGVTAERDGATAEISGVAPAAQLMVYKGLFATPADPTSSSGATSMLLSMLEASLLDGADIVNNSWGGGPGGSPEGSVYEDVFAAMKDAGVVTVFAAGNDGPVDTSIGCPGCSDDVLTVAATTTDRLFANEVTIEGDTTIGSIPALFSVGNTGIAIESPITAPVIYAGEIDADNFEGCSAYADNTVFSGAIALISRGTCGFVDKVQNAQDAGATAVLVFNSEGRGEAPILMGGLSPDQMIPSLMLPATQGIALAELAAESDEPVNVTIGSEIVRTSSPALADIMADFSSRGPNGDPRFLKPNIAAPGNNIFSGESPDSPGNIDQSFSFKSGTSMASPHVAGAAALIKQMHPDWTADQIKSALVTSSIRDVLKEDALTPADNFDMGAGRLDLPRASTVELTYSDLSMVEADCFLTCDMSITVTNTSDADVSVDATAMFDDPAISATVTPDMATLPAGASAEITVSVDVSTASTGEWSFGGINWTDGDDTTTDYFIPVAIYPISSDEPTLFNTAVSASVAGAGETVVTEAYASNQDLTGMISITGEIDNKYAINPASISAIKNGNQQPVSFDAESNTLYWEGALNTATMSLTEDATVSTTITGGYLPMALLGVTPITCTASCDDTAITLPGIPEIEYLGTTYTSLQISSNGFISMGTSSGSVATPYAEVLPNRSEPNNILAPYWTDFDLAGTAAGDTGAGNMYAALLGGGTLLVIEWENAQLWDIPGTSFNFQIWYDYTTKDFYYVYGEMSDPQYVTVAGAENIAGSVGVTLGALTENGVQGTLPVEGDEFRLGFTTGEELSISYEGTVLPASDYMDDALSVNEDASIKANILANEEDSLIINSFTMSSLSGNYRSFTPITIDKEPLDPASIVISQEPANGSVEVNDDGTVTYSPNPDFFGEDSFKYTVATETVVVGEETSGGDVIGEATVNVSVAGVQDAPVINVSAPSSVDEGEEYTITASATDADGDDVTITIEGMQTTSYTGTAPSHEASPSISLVVTATDGIDTTTETVNIQVKDKSGGSMGWLALLLTPFALLRRRKAS